MKAHRSYILTGLSLWHACCQIQYVSQCIIMHWDWVETSLGLHCVVGIALCGRYCIVWWVLHCVVHYILMVRLADQSNISHPGGLPVSHTATTTNPHLTPWPTWPTHSIRSWQPPIRMVTRIIKSQFCEPSFGEVLNFPPSPILYLLGVIFVQPLEKDHFD